MSTYSIGLLNQLGDALHRAGWTAKDVSNLKQFKDLTGVKNLLNEEASIVYRKHVIDCDAAPFIPNGWTVEEHRRGGRVEFDPQEISLYCSGKQNDGAVKGYDLRKELANMPVMNANVLDYLLAHPGLIPDWWQGLNVFFWGTIYRAADGLLFVRCLGGFGHLLDWATLDDDFTVDSPAAVTSIF